MTHSSNEQGTSAAAEQLQAHHFEDFTIFSPVSSGSYFGIRTVETRGAAFEVDGQSLNRGPLRALVWGALGRTNESAGHDMHVTVATMRTHRANLYTKIGAGSMAHAVGIAFKQSILRPESPLEPLKLSPRQLELLALASQGHTHETAAAQMYITLSTAKTHANEIFWRNRLANVAHAVTMVHLSGQLPAKP